MAKNTEKIVKFLHNFDDLESRLTANGNRRHLTAENLRAKPVVDRSA